MHKKPKKPRPFSAKPILLVNSGTALLPTIAINREPTIQYINVLKTTTTIKRNPFFIGNST